MDIFELILDVYKNKVLTPEAAENLKHVHGQVCDALTTSRREALEALERTAENSSRELAVAKAKEVKMLRDGEKRMFAYLRKFQIDFLEALNDDSEPEYIPPEEEA